MAPVGTRANITVTCALYREPRTYLNNGYFNSVAHEERQP